MHIKILLPLTDSFSEIPFKRLKSQNTNSILN